MHCTYYKNINDCVSSRIRELLGAGCRRDSLYCLLPSWWQRQFLSSTVGEIGLVNECPKIYIISKKAQIFEKVRALGNLTSSFKRMNHSVAVLKFVYLDKNNYNYPTKSEEFPYWPMPCSPL